MAIHTALAVLPRRAVLIFFYKEAHDGMARIKHNR
jgi:hypothetical protein